MKEIKAGFLMTIGCWLGIACVNAFTEMTKPKKEEKEEAEKE